MSELSTVNDLIAQGVGREFRSIGDGWHRLLHYLERRKYFDLPHHFFYARSIWMSAYSSVLNKRFGECALDFDPKMIEVFGRFLKCVHEGQI